jgi:tetratricopeptide (TPR) repeat protein
MKHLGGRIAILAALIVVLISAIATAQQPESAPELMSFWQARRAVLATGNFMFVPGKAVRAESIVVTRQSVEFDAGNRGQTKHYRIDLKDMEPLARLQCGTRDVFCHLRDAAGKKFVITSDPKSTIVLGPVTEQNASVSMAVLRLFPAALNSLHALAASQDSADFHQRATEWRALGAKPPLIEGARIRRLAAEDAIRRQKPYEALNYYELGVEADPTWAQGWFNAAVIAGQLGYYPDAAEHMQNYLELVPNASDVQSARDQIDLWKYKAGHADEGK